MAHQREGVAWLLDHPRAVLADDVGLGKTVQALAYAALLSAGTELRRPRQLARVLIVTDASLISQWAAETMRFLPSWSVVTTAELMAGGKAATAALSQRLQGGVDVVIASYDALHARRAWVEKLRAGLVVLDEAAAIKGMGTTWESVCAVTLPALRVVALTATPVENDLTELYAVLAAVRAPGLPARPDFNQIFIEWAPAYHTPSGVYVPARPVWCVEPALPLLWSILDACLLRRTAEGVGLALPEIQRRHVFVRLTAEQRAAYAAATNRYGLAGHQARERAGLLAEDVSSLSAAMANYLAWGQDKAIVYTESLDHLSVAEGHLGATRISWGRIDGGVKGKDRDETVRQFREDESPRVLLGSRVLERGLNLQTCRTLLSLGSSWNPAREAQREGRIRRIGSEHKSVEHVTMLPDTPHEHRKLAEVGRKRNLQGLVFGQPEGRLGAA